MMPFFKRLLAFLIIDASLSAKAYADFAARILKPQDFQKGSSLLADTCLATEQEATTQKAPELCYGYTIQLSSNDDQQLTQV